MPFPNFVTLTEVRKIEFRVRALERDDVVQTRNSIFRRSGPRKRHYETLQTQSISQLNSRLRMSHIDLIVIVSLTWKMCPVVNTTVINRCLLHYIIIVRDYYFIKYWRVDFYFSCASVTTHTARGRVFFTRGNRACPTNNTLTLYAQAFHPFVTHVIYHLKSKRVTLFSLFSLYFAVVYRHNIIRAK